MDYYLGMIFPSAISFVPVGFSWCNGAQLQISQLTALYSLIGVAYGGDARSYFNLPDLRGRVMLGNGQSSLGGTAYVNGNNGGQPLNQQYLNASQLTLTNDNLPAHTHGAVFTPVTGSQSVTIPAVPASGSITGSGTVGIVPGYDASSQASPAAGKTYYLTGVQVSGHPTATGPYTTTAPSTVSNAAAVLGGVNVTVDTSTYQPAIPQSTVNVNAVTGGAVVNGVTGSGRPVAVQVPPMPWEVVTFMICTQGVYPSRP